MFCLQEAALKQSKQNPEIKFYLPEVKDVGEEFVDLVKGGRDRNQYECQTMPGAPNNVVQSTYCGRPVVLKVLFFLFYSSSTINYRPYHFVCTL